MAFSCSLPRVNILILLLRLFLLVTGNYLPTAAAEVEAADTAAKVEANPTGDVTENNINTTDTDDNHELLYMEPDVRRYPGALPPEVCKQVIALGEKIGFPLEYDTIDAEVVDTDQNIISQSIDVMDEDGTVKHPEIYALLEPHLPALTDMIVKQRSEELTRRIYSYDIDMNDVDIDDLEIDTAPQLGWIFYRKYSPDTPRNSLIPHSDYNLNTVNIALNDDFEGGGLFYVKPSYEDNPDWLLNTTITDYLFKGPANNGLPDVPYDNTSYEWVDGLNRQNSSNVVFPALKEGDALIHNYTVWHGIAPITKGTRYSLLLFFDQDNPMLERSEEEEAFRDAEGDMGMTMVSLKHNLKECNPNTGKLDYVEGEVCIFWVHNKQLDFERENPSSPITDNYRSMHLNGDNMNGENDLVDTVAVLKPGMTGGEPCHPGQVYRAIRWEPQPNNGEDVVVEILSEIKIEEGKTEYEFVTQFTTQEDCDALAASRNGIELDKETSEL